MTTLMVDNERRIQLGLVRPHQVFRCEHHADGSILLTPVEQATEEPFPRGSLLTQLTEEREAEVRQIAEGCLQGPQ